jgi:predicted RNA-binding protein with TRAM domain
MYYEKRGRQSGRNFGSRRFPPKPVDVGKEYEVEILELSRRGEGIARIEGLVCFIPNTSPGEQVKIRITRISRRFAEGEVLEKLGKKQTDETAENNKEEES